MSTTNGRHAGGLVFLLAAMLVMAIAAYAAARVRVGGWSLRANGRIAKDFQYRGACPVDLKFGWSLLATEPTTVTYTYDRSDGARESIRHTLHLPAANRSGFIYYDWRLGANTQEFANFSGWVQLVVESPNPVYQKIPFTLRCR
jgi:hypothetical protein